MYISNTAFFGLGVPLRRIPDYALRRRVGNAIKSGMYRSEEFRETRKRVLRSLDDTYITDDFPKLLEASAKLSAEHTKRLSMMVMEPHREYNLFKYEKISRLIHSIFKDPKYAYLVEELKRYGYDELNDLRQKIDNDELGYKSEIEETRMERRKLNFESRGAQMLLSYLSYNPVLAFTTEEIEFLVSLHRRVVSGELSLDAPFTAEGLQ